MHWDEFRVSRWTEKYHHDVVWIPLLTIFASIFSLFFFQPWVVCTARLRDSVPCLPRSGVRGLGSSVANPLETQGGTPELGRDG